MELGLSDRVALVCGASKGIGKAIALELSRERARVAICSRSETNLVSAQRDIESVTGAKVASVAADLGVRASIQRLVRDVEKELGAIDILINNVGGPPPGGLMDLTDEQWTQAIEQGLMSTIILTRAVLPGMIERKWGRIVTIASNTVQQPREDLLLSSAIRAAVAGFNKAIAARLARHNVLIHTVCPGPTKTQRMADLASSIASAKNIPVSEAELGLTSDVPMARMGTPEEVAALVVCLASDRLAFMTGTTIPIDGGQLKGRH